MKGYKQFGEVRVKKVNVTRQVHNTDVGYKVFNGKLRIDLKGVVDGVLEEQGIAGYKTDAIELSIPFSIDKQVTGNCIALIVNKKRFTIRLKDMEVDVSKVQKIDHDNTKPHRWSTAQWFKFLRSLHFEYYGIVHIDLVVTKDVTNKRNSRDAVYGRVKTAIEQIKALPGLKLNDQDIVDYFRWAFRYKSEKMAISLGLLKSNNLIQDWLIWKKKGKRANAKKIKRKWDD